ncbi:MAG: carboxymuconolactone decarboxylase family protein [Firmicutes bacterium]|nr:carboxymuconolactone decarboxylase family protein [Bacillota bacterium]
MEKFQAFDQAVFAEGAIPVKYKQLMAITAAHITQCPFCIDAHTRAAQKAGASDAEIAEAVFVAMAMRAGGSMSHGAIAMRIAHDHG